MPDTPQHPAQPDGALRGDYEALPYVTHPAEASSIHHIATAAVLLGLTPAHPTRCRVLELGAGSGGNLLPMAASLPGSEFLGIDLSPRHVAASNDLARAAGLSNIRFETMDFAELPASIGAFDYVIAHGLYSWIPRDKADQLLAVIARHLSPVGVGYVSFNTYPGWHLRGMVRDMMLYHTRNMTDASPTARVIEARRLMTFLEKFGTDLKNNPNQAHAINLQAENKFLATRAADYIAHDHMERYNEPVYFWQFADSLRRHALQYLDESLSPMWHASGVKTVLEQMPQTADDPVALEQYVDFLMCTFHRQSLIVPAAARLTRNDAAVRLDHFFARGIGRDAAAPDLDLRPGVGQPFPTREGVVISIKDQLLKAVLKLLDRSFPQSIPLDSLLSEAAKLVGLPPAVAVPGAPERRNAERAMLHCHRIGMLTLLAYEQPAIAHPGPRPMATPLARLQAQRGAGITTLLHQWLPELPPAERNVLTKCDGSHSIDQLDVNIIKRLARAGLLSA